MPTADAALFLDQEKPRQGSNARIPTSGRPRWTRKRQRMINKANRDAERIRAKERVNVTGEVKE